MQPILEAIDEPALIVSEERVVAANEAVRQLLGQRIIGADVRLAIRHPQVLEMIAANQRATINAEGIGRTERPWTVIGVPIGDKQMLIRLVDRAAARAAERMRVDFVANASHELRTPLATILGYAETLADEDAPPEDMRQRFAGTIRSEAQRMLKIVEDLMALSRIEAGRFVLPKDDIDFALIVREAVEHNEVLAERKNASLRCNVDADLPTVRGDAAQLAQLTENLIGNALRYGCNDDHCAVDVTLSKVRGRIRLEVRDQGDGISAEHLPRLTERFYRVDPARSRDSGGTGLGLAIVKHIAERHRAALDIASAPGKGTRVTVEFPIAH